MENHKIDHRIEHIFILGAGASADYKLPLWGELGALIEEEVNNNKDKYIYHNEIKQWINMVGSDKIYKTIDECITSESISVKYHNNGDVIEDQLFCAINEIFFKRNQIKENEIGWIEKLNEKILTDATKLEDRISFISFNYDDILDKKFLNFNYLPSKRKALHRPRLTELNISNVSGLFPHGSFSKLSDPNINSHIYKTSKTYKSGVDIYATDAISCHDGVAWKIEKDYPIAAKIYILGIGGGLSVNLKKIIFNKFKISEIYMTIWDKDKEDEFKSIVCEVFKKSSEEINTFPNCQSLIENCF